MSSFSGPPFEVTDPLGFPRPIRTENVFGSRLDFFADNLMPVPEGFLNHFHHEYFWPYVVRVAKILQEHDWCWEEPRVAQNPSRYCFVRDGRPTRIPAELRPLLIPPPAITMKELLEYFDVNHGWADPMQLLDLLTLFREDLGRREFDRMAAAHPWVSEFMQ